MNLRIPGPTPVPEDVLQASAAQMINHRGPEYKALIERVTDGLKRVLATEEDVFILTCSGTGAMEAAIVNMLSPGDHVLNVSIGVFGDRFAQISEAYGARVTRLEFEWGTSADPDKVREALNQHPDIVAVSVTHNETSTGVTNDLESIAGVVKGEFGKLLLVDGVSSVSSIPLLTDQWRCDVVATGSQKGWMAPPGLAFNSVSQEAWQAYEKATMPRFYFDFGKAKQYLKSGQNPWTPAVSVMYAMDAALEKILAEGIANVYERHASIAQMTRDGIEALGLELFPKDEDASNTVTAIKVPEGVECAELVRRMRTEYEVVIAPGQGRLTPDIFRIGHMGFAREEDIRGLLDALADLLPKIGFKPSAARSA